MNLRKTLLLPRLGLTGRGGVTLSEENTMRFHSLFIASAITTALALPAMGQESSTTHRYQLLFKYSDQAIKAMRENPQDRSTQAAKLFESLGGKMENIYFFPLGGEYDGMIIAQMPNDAALTALNFVTTPSGNFSKSQILPLMTADEFKGAMEKAKGTNTTYTPPTATRQ
jgi:uncharacterized protein with GYD domain